MVISMKSFNQKIEKIKNDNDSSADIKIREYQFMFKKVACIYLESVSSGSDINDFILKSIGKDVQNPFFSFFNLQKKN